ncbi:unnamed protein product [Rotaria sp. Silwood1]|nr:unnamed protein product [Rotaria sp. Silwood1]
MIIIFRFIKEWDKLAMWKQLGFPLDEATANETNINVSLSVASLPLLSTSLPTIRHHLHAQPELSGQEKLTAALIIGWLQEAGAERIITGLGGHGVAGVFSGRDAGPRVMLRAELDALPISELGEGREWCSRNNHVAQSIIRN